MRRAAAAVLALVVVGGVVSYAAFWRGADRPVAPTSPPPTAAPRLLVGFLDDANFRWRSDRAVMLDGARDAGARLVRALV